MRLQAVAMQGLFWLGLPSLVLAGTFEGIVVMKRSSDGEVTTGKTYFKDEKMRVDEQDGGYTVWDAARKEGFVVDSTQKTVVVMPWREMKAEDTKKMFEGLTVTKTGKRDKVAGHPCETYSVKDDDDGAHLVCVAKGIGNGAIYGFLFGDPSGRVDYPAWLHSMVTDGGFPLRVIDRDEGGTIEAREEAVKVQVQSLEAALFLPPPGYAKTDFATAMKQYDEARRKKFSR